MNRQEQNDISFGEFIRQERKLVAFILISTVVCWAKNAFSMNVRIDGEHFINNPGTLQGWLSVGRFGMLPVKWFLGNINFNPYFSGILFLLIFSVVCILWLYLFSCIMPGIRYRWVFALLYVSSNTWAYMFYFTMMSAEIAVALLITVLSLIVFTKHEISRKATEEAPRIICVLLLVIAFGCYQAVIPVFVSGAAICILLWQNSELISKKTLSFQTYLLFSLRYIAPFAAAYIIFSIIAKIWFTSGDYLSSMSMWRGHSFNTCAIMIAGRIAQTLGVSPERYSFAFLLGCILCIIMFFSALRGRKLGNCLPLLELTWTVLLLSPFIILFRLGGQMIPRMQFSLQLVAAFTCMYALNKIEKKQLRTMAAAAALAVSLYQVSILERLYYTDDVRASQDEALAFELSSEIEESYGKTDLPVVFVGRRDARLNNACLKTDVYGASLFSWDYSESIPSAGTPRCTGCIQAVTGHAYKDPTTEQLLLACIYANDMPSYPEDGYISERDGIIIIKLSD